MKTDKQVFLIFQTQPEWLFKLIGKPSPGKCRMRSVTRKALERTTDGLIEPFDPSQDLTISEFQFQFDLKIYLRVIEAMTGAQGDNNMRGVRGIIIFADASLDPKTQPWNSIVESFVLKDCIQDLENREPSHPLVAVFKPLLEKQDDVLESHAADYYQSIKQSNLKPTQISVLVDVFVDWLGQRLSKKSKKEMEMLLFGELPGLENTRCGQDLINIGEKRGVALGVKKGVKQGVKQGAVSVVTALLESKFGRVPRTVQSRINRLEVDALKSLTTNVLSFDRISDVKQWLDAKDN